MNILTDILKSKKEEVARLKKRLSKRSFIDSEFYNEKSLSFYNQINGKGNIAVIAEIKKASPSKGLIKEDFNHLEIAETYFSHSVNAVSILTDHKYFKGEIGFLYEIAGIKQAPLLRKDFIIDEIQIYEAKANGADLILLICEALSKNQIEEFTNLASEIGLEVLLELHNENQLEKIDFGLNKIIGVNNRNLEDFSVDLSSTQKISTLLPHEVVLVSESGISKKEDIDYLKSVHTDAVLVGEHLMRSDNIDSSLDELRKWCTNES